MPIADASPLIYLAKTERLYLLKELYGLVQITPSVYREVVVKGEEKGFEDAIRVKKDFSIRMNVPKRLKR
jgi:predicted nucleic acid-binding protein